LGEKYGWPRLDGACQRALAFELLNVKRVERILRLDLDRSATGESSTAPAEARVYPLRPRAAPRFARPAESFAHHSAHSSAEPIPLFPAHPAPAQPPTQEIVND
jgi:hypothetical protein